MFKSFMPWMFNREAEKGNPEEILRALGDLEGLTVGDIGSGGGFFALRFAEAVGPKGKVFAIDRNVNNLEYVRRLAEQRGYGNIHTVFTPDDNVPLQKESIDLVFSRNSFHHLPAPGRYFDRLRALLKPKGRVVIIEHLKTGGLAFVNLFGHYTSEDDIETTLEKAGYQHVRRHTILKGQSFNIFEMAS